MDPMGSKHKLVRCDHDLFNILYRQGNEVLDSSVINPFIKTQNIPMLIETVCHALDLCERYGSNTRDITLVRDPTLIGNRFALKGVIDTLAINQGHADSSSDYTLGTVSLMFTYNPEALHFVALLRSSTEWTSKSFRHAFKHSPYQSFLRTLQTDIPYIPISLVTRFKIGRAIELQFVKYTSQIPIDLKPANNNDKSQKNDTNGQNGQNLTQPISTNPHKFDILPALDAHIAAFAKQLAAIPGIKEHLDSFYLSPDRSSHPSTLLYNDAHLELPVHLVTTATDFLSNFVYSAFAGYGVDVKQFTDQIPQVLLRYLAISIQTSNFELFKFMMSLEYYIESTSEDEQVEELQSSTNLDEYQRVYNALPYGNQLVPLPNHLHHDLKSHIPQAIRIANMFTEGVVTKIFQKYQFLEKIAIITAKIGALKESLSAVGSDRSNTDSKAVEAEKKAILKKIAVLKLKAQSYWFQTQLAIRFHEGLWSLYRYDFATPSQLIMLYIAASQYGDELILDRLKTHYKMNDADLMDYDNSIHLDNISSAAVKTAYKGALADSTFKGAKQTLIHEIFYVFSTFQLPRCIEYYVKKIKRKKSVIDLPLPLNPIAVAVTNYDVDVEFLQALLDMGTPFIPHSRFGHQFNIVLALLRSTYDQPQDRTVELLEWCKEWSKSNTKEKMVISMDEFFATMAKITRLPLYPETSPAQIRENMQNVQNATGMESLMMPSIPIDDEVALELYPKPCGYRTKVLQWIWDNALDMTEWRGKVLSSPEVVVQALTGFIELSEPTPVSYAQNSVEFLNFESDLLTMMKFFIVKENAQLVFRHQKFSSVVSQLISFRATHIFEFLFQEGYILDKQSIYLFSMATPTFTDFNDFNVYVPSYRELVTTGPNGKNGPNGTSGGLGAGDIDFVTKWRSLEDEQIPYLGNGRMSSQHQGQQMVAAAEFILLTKRAPADKKPKIPKLIRKKGQNGQKGQNDQNNQGDKSSPDSESPLDENADGDSDLDENYDELPEGMTEDDFDEDWDKVDWASLSPGDAAIKTEKLKIIYQQQIDRSMKITHRADRKMKRELLSYPIDYDYIPARKPAQAPKFRSLRRFMLSSRDGLGQFLSSGVLADPKKEDVLARLSIPSLQFDILEPLCLPDLKELYPQIKSSQQMELVLSSASKGELGKCCWTVLQYLYRTYFQNYQSDARNPSGSIPFSHQSNTLSLLMLFIQYCPDIEYALYMLMTPVDGVGFIATSFQWMLYKIVVETFPTGRIPFSLFGKLYFYSPFRPTSSLATHLSVSLMTEDILRHAIDSFNRYTIAGRESLEESNQEMYEKMVQTHSQSLKKALRLQQQTGKEPEIPPEPHSYYELFFQEFRYSLDYHGHNGHYYKDEEKKNEAKTHRLAPDSAIERYSPLRILDLSISPSPIIPTNSTTTTATTTTTAKASDSAPKEYINQRYFNMLSFDTQFNPSSPSTTNDSQTNQGIFISNLAQRALIALVCDLIYHYKLDEEIPKETHQHRDIREAAKQTTDRNHYISSLTIFRRIFSYTRFINLQLAFFIAHLIPSTDIFMSLDLIELQAFFIGAGRSSIFDEESMFVGQPLQYHVFPNPLQYRDAVTKVMANLYQFNGSYVLNSAQENMKIMAKATTGGAGGAGGEQPQTKPGEKPIPDLIPQPALTQFNMANYYTKYFNLNNAQMAKTGVLKGKSNALVYDFDLIPQHNNALSPYLLVDLDGTLAVNEDAKTMDELWKDQLVDNATLENQKTLYFPFLVEEGRKHLYGEEPAPVDIPTDLISLEDKTVKDSKKTSASEGGKNSDASGDGNNDPHSSQNINISIDRSQEQEGEDANATGGGLASYLVPIGAALASLAVLGLGSFFFLNQTSPGSTQPATAATGAPKQRKKQATQQQSGGAQREDKKKQAS